MGVSFGWTRRKISIFPLTPPPLVFRNESNNSYTLFHISSPLHKIYVICNMQRLARVCHSHVLYCNIEICSGLEKSPFGAKSDFEIWAFKVFLFFGPEKSSKEGLEVATPENLKWKKYIRQSENADGSPLEPLWGSKKLKVSTKRTLRPTNLPFWFEEKSSWCRFEKKRKFQKVLHFWSGEKSWWCSF